MGADSKKRNYCRRCGYLWNTRVEHPAHCPKCKSKLWNTDNVLWSCGSCGNLREYRGDKPAPTECPRCGSSAWRCATALFQCGCGYSAHYMNDRDAVCPLCKVRMARSDGKMSFTGSVKVPKAGKEDESDPFDLEILERFGRGEGALTIAREMGISFETVMKAISGL